MRRLAGIAALSLVLALPAAASASWQQVVPGSLNASAAHDHDGNGPSLVEFGGAPTVAFSEDDGAGHNQVWVRRLVNGAWVTLGNGLRNDSSQAARNPSLAVVGGTLYAAWDEAGKVRVASWNGTSWSFFGPANGLVDNGGFPVITDVDGVPWVVYVDGALKGHAAYYDSGAGHWTVVASTFDHSVTGQVNQPDIEEIGGHVFVAWWEYDASHGEVRVAKYNGSGWTEIDGGDPASPINHSQVNNYVGVPRLADLGGIPWISWSETDPVTNVAQIRVAHMTADETGWQEVIGGPSPINHVAGHSAYDASLAIVCGRPWVLWREATTPPPTTPSTPFRLHAARLNASGTAWEAVDGGGDPDNPFGTTGFLVNNPRLTEIGETAFVAWDEKDGSGVDQTHVARLAPDLLAASATPTDRGATLAATWRTYGMPVDAGFTVGANDTATVETGDGDDEATIVTAVSGLTPATSYQWRPFALAGVPAPRVLGAAASFMTEPANGPGATGPTGPGGATGPAGPQGRPGRDATVKCKLVSHGRKVSCTVKFAKAARATLSRHGHRVAAGRGATLHARHRLGHGRYVLRLVLADGRVLRASVVL